jgi:hypothetical protein
MAGRRRSSGRAADEADPAKAQVVANLKRALESPRSRIEELERALGE